jgi:GntR family transcriptional regulator
MLDQLENMPLAEQAREAILQAILSERFDGGRLPSEDELAKMLNVSRTTVRTALHSLEEGGILTRRRAVGTTVNSHVGPDVLALQRLVGFDWLLSERGHEVRADVSWERGPRPEDVGEQFGDAGGDFLLTSKLYFADGAAAIYVRDIVPWREIELEPASELPPSLFEFSRRHCRNPIDHAVVQLVPMVNDGAGATRLDVPAGAPYVRLHERHYSKAGKLTAFSVIDVDDEFVRFEVFRRHA